MLSARTAVRRIDGRWVGFVCIIPWLVGFLVFQIYPFIASLFYSFTNYSIGKPFRFVGIENYVTMFTNDRNYFKSVSATLIYVFFSVPMKLAFSLFIAVVVNMKVRGVSFFRTAYYLPSILGSSVGIAVLWRSLFNRQGVVNTLFALINIPPIDFLGSPDIAIFTISLLSVWQFGSSMVIFLAALKQVPQEMLEAARIDGAGRLRIFMRITLPLISPMIFFNLIMQTTFAFQQFNSPFLITQGGPLKATYLYGLMLYENAFRYQTMGYACAQSWILFLAVLTATALVFKSSPYWTYYGDSAK
jgi:oligogalacturonide transport system permease protein